MILGIKVKLLDPKAPIPFPEPKFTRLIDMHTNNYDKISDDEWKDASLLFIFT